MKPKIAYTSNIENLVEAYENLINRSPGVPGMGLVHGRTGVGKTTGMMYLLNRYGGIYVRAMAAWTPGAMMTKILGEFLCAPRHRNAEMVEIAIEKLSTTGKPLFVDEANYLVEKPVLLDYLRDIHDAAGIPVILFAMSDGSPTDIQKRIAHHRQLDRRIGRRVEFLAANLDSAKLVADSCCEVKIADDLLHALWSKVEGNLGYLMVELEIAEKVAIEQEWEEINIDLLKAYLRTEVAAKGASDRSKDLLQALEMQRGRK